MRRQRIKLPKHFDFIRKTILPFLSWTWCCVCDDEIRFERMWLAGKYGTVGDYILFRACQRCCKSKRNLIQIWNDLEKEENKNATLHSND